ncbi:neural cell adhesion molecule L1-like protein isoform X2 [Xyrauchen texanus]|nr:neural cell adhesion molecule L1-like protein isoform X2 [Xyrauchen texanus]
MRGLRCLCVALLYTFISTVFALYFPPHVEQLPTITSQTSGHLIALPYDESFLFMCEAKGNPRPMFRWTKDGMDFDPHKDPQLKTKESSGSFVIPNSKDKVKYQGKYRCYASNKLGTAISEEKEFIVPMVPRFPKEEIEPVVVAEGDSVVLECIPPKGIPPLQLYWMTKDLRHIKQNERVSMALNGNLYFSNTLVTDSHDDYCCFASFAWIRTIVQKPSMALRVRTINSSHDGIISVHERKPRFLVPSNHKTTFLKKGEELELECIAEGLPTPTIEWEKMRDSLPNRANIMKYGKLLTIPDVTEQDEGKYMCKAKNSLGEAVHHFHVVLEEPPSWREEPVKIQLAEIGSDIQIKCSAKGKPQPTITWKRNGRLLDDFPSINLKVLDDSIIIHRAKLRDTAVYQCEASNKHGTLLANANVLVMNHPPLILTQNYLEYATMLGKSVIMDCKVFSSPTATRHWRREDPEGSVDGEGFSLLKNGSLQIHRVEMEDKGQYKCLANNSEGTASITTELFIKDSTRIVKPPQDIKVRRGSMTELECLVECDPTLRRELEILWLKDGIDILSNYTEDSGYNIDDGNLQIFNVSHSDEGNYTCIVRTSLDQNMASAYVTVLDVPDPPIQLVLSDLKGRSVMLHWLASNYQNSPITEFIIQYEENHWEPGKWKELLQVSSSQYSAPLMLYGHINYQFRVIAVNAMGRSHPSMSSERYKTPPCAPDRNPENIKIEGHLPHQMDISWEPLLPVEHNGSGLEYKLSYRLLGVEEIWKEQMVKRHSFVVSDTPTFVPYEIKIQAHNEHGWAPEPRVVTGYSGEDLPLVAPENISVEVLNSTLLRVSWSPVPQAALRGHLGGYTVHWWQTQSLLTTKRIPSERQTLSIHGNRSHTMVPGLKPFSQYSLTVNVFNRKGDGPSCSHISFTTPQGVPEQPPILRATNFQKNSITLVWAPPHEANGFLTGYLLEYQTINETLGKLNSVNISSPEMTQWVLHDLREDNWYKFYLSACTEVGCGSAVSEEGGTMFEALSSEQALPSQEWLVGMMCAVAILTLLVLIGCFVLRNKGGKYAVKEKEESPADPESLAMSEETPCQYSDEKPLKSSRQLLVGDFKEDDSSEDSSVISEDEDCEFNDDGSFIGEYSDYTRRGSTEVNGHTSVTA